MHQVDPTDGQRAEQQRTAHADEPLRAVQCLGFGPQDPDLARLLRRRVRQQVRVQAEERLKAGRLVGWSVRMRVSAVARPGSHGHRVW
jgi:hypothetical protein